MVRQEIDFAIEFAQQAGLYMVNQHSSAIVSRKLDRTVVTNVDTNINTSFIEEVHQNFGDDVSVIGEEVSTHAVSRPVKYWVIDPVDGTGEYIDASIEAYERTSCVGIALIDSGSVQLAVVYNPFRQELFVAGHQASWLNGTKLATSQNHSLSWGMHYDYCHWDDCFIDVRFLEQMLGSPLGSYSAINQVCDVARGRSDFAIFPGNTVHDIAPSALLVEQAGGVVSDLRGNALQWDNLQGAVYAANPSIYREVMQLLGSAT